MTNPPLDVQETGPEKEPYVPQEPDALGELRSLLLGREIEERLDTYQVKAKNIAEVLPEAVEIRKDDPDPLVGAMRETVEDSIKESINQDQDVLADTLFPIIGPATRKAVTTAIKTLTDSLNQGLELSLSPQSIGWRIEAWRTGRSFAEVALLRTLLFQVEQVLLIHKETGLMLQDVEFNPEDSRDPELLSAMLTAIVDFVRDSFKTQDDPSFLETVEFGELNLWIEVGPQAALVCVIRGTAPQSLRPQMQETLESIHQHFDLELERFSGDREPFSPAREFLESCLQNEAKPKPKKKRSPLFWIALFLFIALAFLISRETYLQNQWRSALKALEAEPGISIFKAHRGWGQYQIEGIRDPLAAEAEQVLIQHNIDPEKVTVSLEPYWSLSSELIETHVKTELNGPETVSFRYDPLTLSLQLTGKAGQSWIRTAERLPETHPRIRSVDTSALELFEEDQLLNLKADIENVVFSFQEGQRELVGEDSQKFQEFAADVLRLTQLSEQISFPIQIEVRGRTSASGQYEDNARLSQSRADLLMRKLTQQGIPARFFKAQGISVNRSDQNNGVQKPQVDFYVNLKQP